MGQQADLQSAPPIPKQERTVAPWIRRGGPALLAVALLLHVILYVIWPVYALQIDVLVYRFGGRLVVDGADLYAIGRNGGEQDLLFTYTPFAAVFFVPLAFLTDPLVQILSLIVSPLLVVYVTVRILRSYGLTARAGLWGLTALLMGLLLWVQPIRLSIQLGQINILILALVIADVLSPRSRKWAGIGIGLVAGIKLTPAIFIVYLFLVGRVRAALVATATAVATVLIGFAVLPSASAKYWLGAAFANTKRIARDPSIGTSVQSLFERLGYPMWLATALSGVLLVVSLWVAVYAYRRGQVVLSVAIVGMGAAAASPFSWSHHWVWFVPLIVHLGYRGYVLRSRVSAVMMWVVSLVFADWLISVDGQPPASSLLALHPGGVFDQLMPSAYVFVLLIVLISTVWWLRRAESDADTVAEPEPVTSTVTR